MPTGAPSLYYFQYDMTYQSLLDQLLDLTPDQLQKQVIVHDDEMDTFIEVTADLGYSFVLNQPIVYL